MKTSGSGRHGICGTFALGRHQRRIWAILLVPYKSAVPPIPTGETAKGQTHLMRASQGRGQASVYAVAALGHSRHRRASRDGDVCTRGRAPRPVAAAERLPVSHALPARRRALRRYRPGAAADRPGTIGGMPVRLTHCVPRRHASVSCGAAKDLLWGSFAIVPAAAARQSNSGLIGKLTPVQVYGASQRNIAMCH
jgi:hypothetical protein